MNQEEATNYPKTVTEYLQLLTHAIVREDLDPIQIYEIIVSGAKNFPLADREVIKAKEPYNLLVICDQNQGRSQIEEAILKELAQMIGVPLNITSAGVNASPEKYDGKPGPKVIAKMESLGIPMGDAKVTQLKESDINEHTILIALCPKDDIPDFAFKAKVVISSEMEDDFPASKVPKNEDSLNPLIVRTSWLALRIVTKLSEAMEKSNFEIFTKEFEELILTKSST